MIILNNKIIRGNMVIQPFDMKYFPLTELVFGEKYAIYVFYKWKYILRIFFCFQNLEHINICTIHYQNVESYNIAIMIEIFKPDNT